MKIVKDELPKMRERAPCGNDHCPGESWHTRWERKCGTRPSNVPLRRGNGNSRSRILTHDGQFRGVEECRVN